MSTATARACANIALVKYWGKRPGPFNLPAAGSLSLTLDALVTTTQVAFDPDLAGDELVLDGASARPGELARTSEFLDLVRGAAGIATHARVISRNEFPTASGLASSASGFAALALAATRAAGLELPAPELSALARIGSGSAARSIFGGFVEMARGERADGRDAVAAPLGLREDEPPWDLRLVVAITAAGEKAEGSTSACKIFPSDFSNLPVFFEESDSDVSMSSSSNCQTKPRLSSPGISSCSG